MTSRSSVERSDAPNLVTVACVNFAAASGPDGSTTKAARLEKMRRQTRDAHRQGAQMVVFPEGALGAVGPDCTECSVETGPCADHQREAEQVPGPSTNALADLAIELGVYIVFGIDEADPDNPARLYNSAVLVGPEGYEGCFRKLHLGHPLETKRFSPGDELPVFETALGPIGILICYDFWSNPELPRLLALKGVRILINPTKSAGGPGKGDYVRNTTVVRAQENLLYAISANWTGPTGDGDAAGHSTIAGPAFPEFNHVFASAGTDEQVLVTTLNFEQLGRWYDLFPWSDWRLDPERQLPVSRLIADEFAALADGAAP